MKKRNTRRSFREWVQYRIDLWMSRGAGSMILLLFEATGITIVLLGAMEWLVRKTSGESLGHAVWNVLMHTLDPGVISGDTEGSKLFLFLMLLATLAGVFFVALLIGFINDAIQGKMEELSEGRETVIESGHTVILGFSDAAFTILEELIEASENQKGRRNAVVIMGEPGKREMEEKLRFHFSSFGNLTIVCRSGSIYNYTDLARCSILTSRAIIVCAEHDFDTIKAIVACAHILNGAGEDCDTYITAVINQKQNEFAARIAGYDAREGSSSSRLELLMMESTIARIMTHTCRQAGLSKVFEELFNFAGSELSIVRDDQQNRGLFTQIRGKTLREINRGLESSFAVGIIDAAGTVQISDPCSLRLEEGCSLIILEKDDDRVAFAAPGEITEAAPARRYQDEPVRILIMEANSKLPLILEEMGKYICSGSSIWLAPSAGQMEGLHLQEHILALEARGIHVTLCAETEIYDYEHLKKLLEESCPAHVMVLSDEEPDEDAADERSLILLLYLQQYHREHPEASFGITCEMRKITNQVLAQRTVSSDFIISRNMASLMMAQIAENRELRSVFETLLDSSGYEIYLKPASLYLQPGKEWDLFSVSDAVAAKGEVFIGYKKTGKDPVVNPQKMFRGRRTRLYVEPGDSFVVLAEDPSVR